MNKKGYQREIVECDICKTKNDIHLVHIGARGQLVLCANCLRAIHQTMASIPYRGED